MPKLGLIAGNRTFPIHVAKAARALGYEVVAVGIKEETEQALEQVADRVHWVSLNEVGQVPELLKKEGIKEVILAGQIRPERILDEGKFEPIIQQLFKFLPDRSGNSAMKLAVQYLQSQGFQVLDSGSFMKEWIPAVGLLTRRVPTSEEQADITYGLGLARELARLGIGQTVVVRRKAVVAVEGLEGTDEVIRRAGTWVGPGCVVAKACEPGHDMRFDIPVVGLSTLEAMEEAKATCLGIEARRVLLLDRPQLIQEADEKNLAIVAA